MSLSNSKYSPTVFKCPEANLGKHLDQVKRTTCHNCDMLFQEETSSREGATPISLDCMFTEQSRNHMRHYNDKFYFPPEKGSATTLLNFALL
jgi:hypothetical protein